VSGFIDRRPLAAFLGRPCVLPGAFHQGLADTIVYSSREFEVDMHAGMMSHPVEHVLLYAAPPPAASIRQATIASAARRRSA
jgi:hypothetical protein